MEWIGFVADKWEAFAGIASLVGTALLLWLAGHFVRRSEWEKYKKEEREMNEAQDKRHAATDAALASLEARLREMPTSRSLDDIKVELVRMNGRMDANQAQIQGRMDTLQEQLHGQQEILNIVKFQGDRLQSFFVEQGAKK
jgi:hypothetical protein